MRFLSFYLRYTLSLNIPAIINILRIQHVQVSEKEVFSNSYNHDMESLEAFENDIQSNIVCYSGPSEQPKWTDQELGYLFFLALICDSY